MLELIDWKTLAAIGAILLGTTGFLPYFWEIFRGKTQPHLYTWLIWCITQGTATVAVIYGGGGLVGKGLILATVLAFSVFLLSFKYGTKNINWKDVAVLVFALSAVVVWWKLDNPVLAVFMVSAIDGLGYIPTYRKLWSEPWSESLTTWVLFTLAPLLSIFALVEYNLLTIPYLVLCVGANVLLVAICVTRRIQLRQK